MKSSVLDIYHPHNMLYQTYFTNLSGPNEAHRGQLSYPNTIPKRIGPMMIHIKCDQIRMKIVEGVVF